MILSLGVRTSNTTITEAAWEIITGATPGRAKILELGVFAAAATAVNLGLGFPAVAGVTPTSPVDFEPEDSDNVIADELVTGNGYTAGGITLTGISISVNDTSNRVEVTFNNAQWNASGGSLLASGAIIYNSSTLTGSGDDYTDAIVSYKDAGGTLTAVDGTPIIVSSIMETIEDQT